MFASVFGMRAKQTLRRASIKWSAISMTDILTFRSQSEFRKWLAANYRTSSGIWLRIYKKDSGEATVSYAEALDEALCYGWIDGQKQKHDERSWRQKFTPRRRKSEWSKINTGHAERLIAARRMTKAGLMEIEAAKEDGRWESAYNSQAIATFPEEFLRALSKNKKAQEFFDSLSKGNRYAIAYRLQTAKKPETRAKRMKMILEMLRKGEKFH
jgi:uncharacterized protein YdeI (YjbR/CyaY-like superfamily)